MLKYRHSIADSFSVLAQFPNFVSTIDILEYRPFRATIYNRLRLTDDYQTRYYYKFRHVSI